MPTTSLYDYNAAKEIVAQDIPFYAVIMAAMMRADTSNMQKLTTAFPGVELELGARYMAPGGRLHGDPE